MMGQSPVLLVIDDEPGVLGVVRHHAQRAGFSVVTCTTGANAVALVREHRADAAIVDLRMPEIGGLDVLRNIRDASPGCQTILMTGYASIETAVEAIKLGALDYLSKPFDFARLEKLLASVRDSIEQRRALVAAEAGLARQLEFCGMIGRSPAMQSLFDQVRRYAPHLRTALVSGETGTGKELVARALHAVGPRRERPFVVVDCTTSADANFEATLFGTAPSAGTDGVAGAFEQADGGVLFLDEVGDLPTHVQARLMRVIELGELHRVGAAHDRRLDVVVVAATNRDLRNEVAAGRFRSDLLYRLNNVELTIPPLREHRDDIPYLTAAFLGETAERLGKPLRGLTTNAEALLGGAPWDGNVRELRNVIERACMLADGPIVTEQDVMACLPPAMSEARIASLPVVDDGRTLSTVEREHIMKALQRVGGNKKAAARMLGVSRRALYRRLERLELGATIARRRRGSSVNGSSALAHDADALVDRRGEMLGGIRVAARK